MNQSLRPGSELKAKWEKIADATENNWDRNFWKLMAKSSPLPNEDAHRQSHLILFELAPAVRMLIDSLERSGVDLSPWSSEVALIKTELAKREAMSDMFSADWQS